MEMSYLCQSVHRTPSSAVEQLPAAEGAQRVLRLVVLRQRKPAHDTRAAAGQEVNAISGGKSTLSLNLYLRPLFSSK